MLASSTARLLAEFSSDSAVANSMVPKMDCSCVLERDVMEEGWDSRYDMICSRLLDSNASMSSLLMMILLTLVSSSSSLDLKFVCMTACLRLPPDAKAFCREGLQCCLCRPLILLGGKRDGLGVLVKADAEPLQDTRMNKCSAC